MAAACGGTGQPKPTGWTPATPEPTETVANVASKASLSSPSPTIDPATRIPGGAWALPPLPAGVPFTGHLLVTDRGNLRLVEIDPDGKTTWSFGAGTDPAANAYAAWDDAYYGVDGRTIFANSDPTSTVIAIDMATKSVKWHIGTPSKPGGGDTGFSGPDDSVQGLDGVVWIADIKNCRVVRVSGEDGHRLGQLGDGKCAHKPPSRFSSPNGAFPTANGDVVVTEINGQWIDRVAPDGTVRWAFRSPTQYPSDAVPLSDGTILVADYVQPGQVLRLATDGTVLWKFDDGGKLVSPSSATVIASNRVAISDDFNDRILIVDPTTSEIVREYHDASGSPFKWIDCVDYRPD
ncbi:MAG: PQQ-binding-like beta-propeller repeat protein [Chloroflexota bacterium]|nr:PQQ-binding-like beta-propeller repeat protein [Chloroflexota bacterium]